MIEWRWMPALVASTLIANPDPGVESLEAATIPPCSAGAALVRAVEVLAQTSGETVFAIDSAVCEVSSAGGDERAVVTLRLSVFGPDEEAAEEAFEALGRRIATRPWAGEDEAPDYSRWVQALFKWGSSGRWTPGQEDHALDADRVCVGLLTFTIDAFELGRAPLARRDGRGGAFSQAVESFIRSSSVNVNVSVGQVDITAMERTHEGASDRVWGVKPLAKGFTRAQIANLLFLLDSTGPENARVTRIELHRAPGESDRWRFALEYTRRGA